MVLLCMGMIMFVLCCCRMKKAKKSRKVSNDLLVTTVQTQNVQMVQDTADGIDHESSHSMKDTEGEMMQMNDVVDVTTALPDTMEMETNISTHSDEDDSLYHHDDVTAGQNLQSQNTLQ